MSDTFRHVRDRAEIAELAKKSTSPLAQLYFERSGAVSMKWHHYLDTYDRYLSLYRKRRGLRFMEIGIADGGSFNVWHQYFAPDAVLYGIDIVAESKAKVDALGLGAQARIGSQNDPEFLRSVVAEMGGIDIVIDDGSHVAEHQLTSFRTLFPLLADGGLYICEDLHTAYWEDWQGGHRRPGTFIEVVKDIIDSIHAWYGPVNNDLSDMELHRSIPAVHIHDSMVVIEKAKVSPPAQIIM